MLIHPFFPAERGNGDGRAVRGGRTVRPSSSFMGKGGGQAET